MKSAIRTILAENADKIGGRDVVLMDFACVPSSQHASMRAPLICPSDKYPGESAFERVWDTPPAVIGVGQFQKQGAWWKGKTRDYPDTATTAPSDGTVRRIALMGFSEGAAGGVSTCLKNPDDAAQIDFVYACDGLHGSLDGARESVSIPAMQHWVDFAVRAAKGDAMMVVTHSEIRNVNRQKYGTADTWESALALVDAVKQQLGGVTVEPRMIPRGLVGEVGYCPKAVSEIGWPSYSNSLGQSVDILAPWPVKYHIIMGNLIVVGFQARSPQEEAKNFNAGNSEAAHIFQSWWVMKQVIEEVLACRWAAKCTEDTVNPAYMSSSIALRPGVAQSRGLTVNRRFPSVMIAPPKSGVILPGAGGLGAASADCVYEGTFSNLMDAASLESARKMLTVKRLALAAGVGLGAWWLAREYL